MYVRIALRYRNTRLLCYFIVMYVCFRFRGAKIHKETKNTIPFLKYVLNGAFFLKNRPLVLAISMLKVTFVV